MFYLTDYDDWIRQVSYIQEREANDAKRGYIQGAYASWLQGGGGKRSFGEYLDSLGLAEKQKKMTPRQKKAVAEKSIKTAQRILKMKVKRTKK